jgi:hemolysin III
VRDAAGAAGRAGGAGAAGTGGDAGGPGGASAAAPRLRGMLHAGAFPAAAVAAAVLVTLAPTQPARLAAAVYGVTCIALFGVSAAYHRSPPGSRRKGLLARLDHVSILLVIAGTYTPLAVLALHGWTRLSVLAIIWAATAAGVLARLIWRPTWRPAPRWLITSLFIALGWVAVFVLPQLLRGAGALVLVLVLAGGILYSLGAVVYARKRPDPSPQWFGFHEVFHALTILAYLIQYAAVSLVVYRAA